MLYFIFPTDPISPKKPDEMFLDQYKAVKKAGFGVALVNIDKKEFVGEIYEGATLLYRGWMLTVHEYQTLNAIAEVSGYTLFTSPHQFSSCHFLPMWQPLIQDLTPDTVSLGEDADIVNEIYLRGWDKYFVKDFVKSLKTSVGSVGNKPEDAEVIIREMIKYKGFIEGGICIREYEDFKSDSEVRYFVLNGVPHSANGKDVPEIVGKCAELLKNRSPFFSVDVAERKDGVLRVVEIGDGQVSDLVGWDVDSFIGMWVNEVSK